MKIYKYTSLESAVSILKSGGVALNNPKDFNDPNDCSFEQDKEDKDRIDKLLTNYFLYKVVCELTDQNRIKLNKKDQKLLAALRKELSSIKLSLGEIPFFDGMLDPKIIEKMIRFKSNEVDKLVDKAKTVFYAKIEEVVEKAKENALVSCFSRRNNSILMWSHYASSHRGVCIEYDRPKTKDFKNVVYQRNRPSIKLYKMVSHAIALDILGIKESPEQLALFSNEILDPFFVKSKEWAYEREVRCLYSREKRPSNTKYDNNRIVLDIGFPTAIYVGCKAAGDELDHLYRLSQNRGIPVYFMKKSDNTFDIVVDEDYRYTPNERKKPREITLVRLVNDIKRCLDLEIYLAAFAASLIVPGICSQVECSNFSNPKERYIEWCNKYLPCSDRGPDNNGISYLSGELLWNLKEKLFSEGNVDVYGHYGDFDLNKLVLRIEKRKTWDLYVDMLGEGDITTNITKFCADMIYQAERCYRKFQNSIESLSQLPIEDYDAQIEDMEECRILNRRINEAIRNYKKK